MTYAIISALVCTWAGWTMRSAVYKWRAYQRRRFPFGNRVPRSAILKLRERQ